MVEPEEYSYEEFPESSTVTRGMNVIEFEDDIASVVCKRYVNYVERDGKQLKLQFLMPYYTVEHMEKLPCVVFVQVSGWIKQKLYLNIGNLSKLADKGYIIAIVQYRSAEDAPFPAQVQDIKTAIRFLRQNASEYKIDPNNIFLWGDSSGAHVSLITGITSGVTELDTDDYSDYSDKVNGIVDFYGPTDITKMNDAPTTADYTVADSPVGILIGKLDVTKHEDKAQKANVLNYITKGRDIPPIIIFHGSKDRIVPFEQSAMLHEKLLSEYKESTIYKIMGQDHCGPGFWQDEVIDLIDDFFEKHMKRI